MEKHEVDPSGFSEGLRWLRKAIEQKNGFAMNMLGILHAAGRGVEKDTTLSREWGEKATQAGVNIIAFMKFQSEMPTSREAEMYLFKNMKVYRLYLETHGLKKRK